MAEAASNASIAQHIEGFLALLASHASPATVEAYRHDLAALCAFTERRDVTTPAALDTTLLRTFLGAERSRGLAPRSLARRRAARAADALGALNDAVTPALRCNAAAPVDGGSGALPGKAAAPLELSWSAYRT